jgi:hypothetical protein
MGSYYAARSPRATVHLVEENPSAVASQLSGAIGETAGRGNDEFSFPRPGLLQDLANLVDIHASPLVLYLDHLTASVAVGLPRSPQVFLAKEGANLAFRVLGVLVSRHLHPR